MSEADQKNITSAAKGDNAPAIMLSLYEIGRQIVALSNVQEIFEGKQLERGFPAQERQRLEKTISCLYSQEEALVDLGLTMTPETAADAVAQLVLADRRLDEIVALDMEYEDARKIAADALHVLRSSLPLLARAARIDLADVAGQGMLVMAGSDGAAP